VAYGIVFLLETLISAFIFILYTDASIKKFFLLCLFSVGLGFGLMSGAFSLMNVLADSLGPGTLGMRGEPQVKSATVPT
jgi:hypothetical protein